MNKKSFANIILACVVVFLLAGISHSISLPQEQISQDSPFGFHPAYISPPKEYGFLKPYDAGIDIGVKWGRSYAFWWWIIQPDINKQEFKWGLEDEWILSLPDSMRLMTNIYIMDRGDIEKSPDIYLQYAKSMKSFLPKDENAYKNFVKAVVERYDGDGKDDMPGLKNPIKYWQIDNEPQIPMLFGWSADYAELLKMAYSAIKEADPDAKVIIGGATTYTPASSYLKFFDRDFLPILQNLAIDKKRYFDIFDFHWYGNATGDYLGAKEVYNYIKSKINSLGLPLPEEYWITEMSTYSGDPDLPAPSPEDYKIPLPYQSEKQQASDIIKRYVYPLSFGIKKIFPAFGLNEGFGNTDGYFAHTGLIYDGKFNNDLGIGVKKHSYYTYKKMTEILEGSDWDDIQTIQESDGVYIYKFKRGNKNVWVAWNDNSTEKQITISDMISNQVQITEVVPKYESGKEVVDYNLAFNVETKTVSDGKITAILGDKPVFLIGDNFMVDPASANTFESSDGTMVEIPADAVSTAAQLIIQTPANPPATISDFSLKLTPVTREIKLSDGTKQFSKAITITLPYSAADVAGMDEQALRLFFYDDTNKLWALVPDSGVDTVNKHVRGKVTHLTIFGIAQYLPAISGLENLSNYPNPFSPLLGETTKIRYSLEQDSEVRIRIYDPMGQLVWDRSFPAGQNGGAAGPNEVVWDGKSGDGRQVALGGYICIVEAGGSKFKRKIGVK